ncbi:unnamed protein product [Rotaria sp. Silwood1]|nr:unnamed protein product [Rotaria sp. Silwood1]
MIDLTQKDWWFQHYQGCDKEPPPVGDYLELPAGGSFTVEIATNRAFTTFGHNKKFNGYFGGPQELEYTPWGCVSYPNLHTPNQTLAPGTVFAISYQNSIDKVTPENLVVFTVRYKTPWQRVTSYDVPNDLPPCPPGGCTCAWGWIPMGCGQPNMYMQGHKCIVTGSTSTKKLAVAKPPVYCENDRSKCVKGAKQMIFYFQKDGNNVFNVPKMPTDLIIDYRDVKLNLKLLNKYFEVNALDEILVRRRHEFKTRTEHLQKRKEALYEREIMFKERIIGYEMYIKELSMKRDRSLRRIDDEKNLIKNKQIEINLLNQEIQQIQDENKRLENIILQYQPHLNLLTQIVDQTDRFQSIDEMIEKFDMLYASYQDILTTIKNSNEELNDVQRQLVLTIEKKNNKLSLMNNRIRELQQNFIDIQQHIDKIQTEINNYQQTSIEHLTEISTIKIAIESMFDLVKRYSHRCRKKDLNLDQYSYMNDNQCLFIKLKQIDTFLSDLIYYVDYVHNKQNKISSNKHSINNDNLKIKQKISLNLITDSTNDTNKWRGPCQIDRQQTLIATIDKHPQQPYISYKIRGEDDILYTIQMINIDKSNISQPHNSVSPNRSSISMISNNKGRKSSTFRTSISKLRRSIDIQLRSLTTQSPRTSFKLTNEQYNNEKIPFSESDFIH